ncbi:MAG: TMEM165/GDT1 family protein [Planctomycetota bacterium]
MNAKLFLTVFGTVFLAEIGDKTQLATLLFASDAKHGKWTVFAAACLALCTAAAIGVLAGSLVGRFVEPRTLRWVAGVGFVAIGLWTLAKG